MTPTDTFHKDGMTGNGGINGLPNAPDVAPNDGLLRELQALRRSEAVLSFSGRRTNCAARTKILSNSHIRRATTCRNRCGRSIYSELLADRLATAVEGETAEFLEFLRSAANRMELLVRDLLAYTQVTRLDVPLGETDTNEISVRG